MKQMNAKPDRILIIFARQPLPGICKTRLIPFLGAEGAAELQRALLDDLLERTAGLERALYLAEEGVYQHECREALQRGADLGARMVDALGRELRRYGKALLIGCDTPLLSTDILEQGFAALDSHDLALGPAKDGGYYLIGMKEPSPALFSGIGWGGGAVLQDTLQIAGGQKLSCALLPRLTDIDVWEDIMELAPALSPRSRMARLLHRLGV